LRTPHELRSPLDIRRCVAVRSATTLAVKAVAPFGQGSNSIKSAEQSAGHGMPIAKNLIDRFRLPPERVVSGLAPIANRGPLIQADMASSRHNRPNPAKKPLFASAQRRLWWRDSRGWVRWAIPMSRFLALSPAPRVRQRGWALDTAARPTKRIAGWALRFT
jgi:hypothetical protein